MSRLTRKSAIQGLLALALVAAGYYGGAVTSAQAPAVDPREAIQRLTKELTDQPVEKLAVAALPNRVESLLKAKRDVLKLRHETVVAMFEIGASASTEVVRARMAWIDAELDLTRDPTQRIKLLRENIDAAVQIEALILAKIENGAAGGEQISYLAAQAARFDAELRLANELLAQNKAQSK